MSTLRVATIEFEGSGFIKIPVGTTEQRPTGEAGMVRYNSTTDAFEGHNASGWGEVTKVVSANTFGTINANSTLVVADTPGDVLNLVAGNNVTFGVDAGNKKITINSPTPENLSGFRNKIINGDFDIWQRATTFALTGGQYTVDRWVCLVTGAATVSRQSFTLGQTDVPGNPAYFLGWNITTNSGLNGIEQRIEGVKTLSGRTATITFYAKVASGTLSLPFKLVQNFGSGGSPSADVTTDVATASLTTSWQKFSTSVAIPSISGKTLGSNVNDKLELFFDATGLGTPNIHIAHVSIVEGDATGETDPFSPRHPQQELALCQRYYYRFEEGSGKMPFGAMQVYGANLVIGGRLIFPVTMRIAPTCAISGSWSVIKSDGNIASVTTPTLRDIDRQGVSGDFTTTGLAGTAGQASNAYTSANSVVTADAEL